MVEIRTAKEKKELKEARNKAMLSRFDELTKEYDKSDATILVANEYNVSVATIYNIRRQRNGI